MPLPAEPHHGATPLVGAPPHVIVAEPNGPVRTVTLHADLDGATIGRRDDNDVVIDWDPNVSRVHAQLQRLGSEWTVVDDGLSRNGTTVNGEALTGRRRLRDGDIIQVGFTRLTFRITHDGGGSTVGRLDQRPPPRLTETQRQVLVALCRPCLDPRAIGASPASNRQIADELCLSEPAVKTHLRRLFTKFEIDELPHHVKRTRLVAVAIDRGALRR